MLAQSPDTRRHPLLRWIAAAVVIVVVLGGGVLLLLHHRSDNPHSAHRLPVRSGDSRVNSVIERRAQEFLTALRSGDESRLRALAFDAYDRDNITAFVEAFGKRNDSITSLQPNGEGGTYGDLTITVPCKDGTTQQALVPFGWKRTNFISSNWFAFINKPGTQDVQPAGCPAP